jgi:hypothetical protein
MIITETITINNTDYIHTYSDLGYQVERDGIIYEDAIDPIDSGRTYTEVIVEDEDITSDDFLKLIEEAL